MVSPITERQFERVRARHPGALLERLPSGAGLVTIPEFGLPTGWTSVTTAVRFIVPVGYPGPVPDCFWAATGLRLANGQMPQNAQEPNAIPETTLVGLWFSWHVTDGGRNWSPARDDLMTFVSIIAKRFTQLQ